MKDLFEGYKEWAERPKNLHTLHSYL